MVISHDRYLIERIADNTYALFGDGKLTNLPGGIQQYLDQRADQARTAGVLDLGEGQPEAVEKQMSSQEERELQKKMKALERKIAKENERAEALEAEIAALSEAGDFDAIGAKTKELTAVKDAREELEMEWLELGEKLEG